MNEGCVDNRDSSRYEAVTNSAYLGWWEESEFRTAAASLQNLSHGGALVHMSVGPPGGVPLWLCQAKTPPGAWVQVEAVSASEAADGVHQIHLRFPESCPYEMFNSAVLGFCAEP